MTELRFSKDGVPIYDGSPELYVACHRAALTYAETIEWKKRSLVGPRLQAALEGSAKMAVEHMALVGSLTTKVLRSSSPISRSR